MFKRKFIFLSMLTGLSLSLFSCGPTKVIEEDIHLESINLSISSNDIFIDETAKLTVTFNPLDAKNKNFTYSFNPIDSISISENVVTPLKVGDVVITATSEEGNFASSVNLKINERENMVDNQTLLKNLKSNIYSTEMNSEENWGLNSIKNVGINENKLNNEVLYPVPTTDIKEYIAEDHNVSFDGSNNSGNLSNLLSSLSEVQGTKVVRFKKGTYIFNGSINAKNIEDCYLVGEEGTKFVYTGWVTYINITLCKNFHVNNIIFDMNPSPTVMGTVVGSSETSTQAVVSLSIPSEFDLSNSIYETYKNRKTGSYSEYYFDEYSQAYVPDRNANLFYNPGLIDLNYDSSNEILKVTLSKSFGACSYKTPKVGTVAAVAFQVYEHHGFYVQECTDTYFEHVTTYVVAGMGLRVDNGKNFYANHFNFMRDPTSKRLITCCADILHTCNIEGDAKISNSILEGSHDDAVNVKSFYVEINQIRGNLVSVSQTQSEVTIGFSVGDKVEVYNPTRMQYKDTFEVVEVVENGTSYDLTLDRSMPSKGTNSYLGFILGNATKAVHLDLSNTLIKNKRNRGILLQGKHSKITNCTFLNVVMGAVQVLGVGDSFKEAIVPEDVVISNCKFIQNVVDISVFTHDGNGDSTTGTLKNVTIENNFFYRSLATTINLLGVGDINVLNNLFYEKNEKNYSNSTNYANNVTFKDNVTCFDSVNSNYQFIIEGIQTSNLVNENNIVKGAN